MKSLLDIQQDIRKLESIAKNLADNIRAINSDIEEIKNSAQSVDIDYSKIEVLAEQIAFNKHPLGKLKDERVCKVYLEMLLNIIRLEPEQIVTVNRLVFLQWLLIRSGIDWSLEDLYKDCLKMSKASYYEFGESIPIKYREHFMVDALILANINGCTNREIMEYVAELCVILGMGKEKLRILSVISRMALNQNVMGISRSDLSDAYASIELYNHYLSPNLVKQAKKTLRNIAVKLGDEFVGFKWEVKNMQMVEEGDVIATYWREGKGAKTCRYSGSQNENKRKKVLAHSSGKLFQFRDGCINYGVIAHENDNKDSIKAWVKDKKKRGEI